MAHQLYLKENLIITSNKIMWGITSLTQLIYRDGMQGQPRNIHSVR